MCQGHSNRSVVHYSLGISCDDLYIMGITDCNRLLAVELMTESDRVTQLTSDRDITDVTRWAVPMHRRGPRAFRGRTVI